MELLSRPECGRSTQLGASVTLPQRRSVFLLQTQYQFRCPIRTALEERGFNVIAPGSLEAALQIWARTVSCIDVFLADILLQRDPKVERLAKLLRAENPRMRVLFISGLESAGWGGAGLICPKDLVSAVENSLP